jgi:hypothetical protein
MQTKINNVQLSKSCLFVPGYLAHSSLEVCVFRHCYKMEPE